MGARILVVDDSPTIRKVVSQILGLRDFEPITAEDGQDALEKLTAADANVDLVLLDFVMPRMNGYQFCRQLRAREDMKDLPVVLMSAKGDRIRGQFVQQTGAIDAITKPFDAIGLVAVIEAALEKHKAGKARPVPQAAEMPDEDTIVESVPAPSTVVRREVTEERGGVIATLLAAPAARALGIDELALSKALGQSLTTENLVKLAHMINTAQLGATQDALSGDLSVISIAEVLQMLQMQHQTGQLTISGPERTEISLYLREGVLDLATSQGLRGEFLLGRYLVDAGVLDRQSIEKMVLKERAEPLGARLVKEGAASAEQIRKALEQQTSELIFEAVRWTRGRFSFRPNELSEEAQEARLAMSGGALVMEGFRRVDEWRLIEGSFDFDEVLHCDPVALERIEDSKLTRQESDILKLIDGERTVREIVDEVEGSRFELCKILYQFLNSRIVRRSAAA